MKNKTFLTIISLVAAITLFLLSPVQAAAAGNAATKFSASAMIYITDPGSSQFFRQAGFNVFQTSQSEIIEGAVFNSSWPELQGAYVNIEHAATAKIDIRQMTLRGQASGIIIVIGTDGSELIGTYTAILQADFYFDEEGNPVFYNVTDTGTWQLLGTSGVFTGIKANGLVSATLAPVGETLGGVMTFTGIYK